MRDSPFQPLNTELAVEPVYGLIISGVLVRAGAKATEPDKDTTKNRCGGGLAANQRFHSYLIHFQYYVESTIVCFFVHI